jgi:hypothetical protein
MQDKTCFTMRVYALFLSISRVSADVPRGTYMKCAYLLFTISFLLVGCHKPDSHPELKDELFLDYKKQAEANKRESEAVQKNIEKLRSQMEKAPPQTGEADPFRMQIREAEIKLRKLVQTSMYFEIAAETRSKKIRKRYIASFNKGEELDTHSEYSRYTAINKYRESSSKAWDSKVPKLHTQEKPKKTAKKEGEEGEHHEGGEKHE